MGKIFCIMGKSATGKDTIYKRLLTDPDLNLNKIVTYTTRPIRAGEKPGEEYFFIDEAEADRLASLGKIVEMRAYNTVHGVWKYMTVEDESLDVSKGNFLVIGTPESFRQCREHFGEGVMVPVLVTVDDGARLERALKRERKQANPKYEEMCRRFLADAKDFSAEKLAEAGIDSSFENVDFETCYKEIAAFIKANLE